MKTVLLFEDDRDLIYIMTFLLKESKINVITGSGYNYQKDVNEHKPDLILLDYWLAGIRGSEMCEDLKKNPETAEIPVLLVSAVTGIEQISVKCKADDFLAKPFDISELENKVLKWLH